jgi:hypothetical protein
MPYCNPCKRPFKTQSAIISHFKGRGHTTMVANNTQQRETNRVTKPKKTMNRMVKIVIDPTFSGGQINHAESANEMIEMFNNLTGNRDSNNMRLVRNVTTKLSNEIQRLKHSVHHAQHSVRKEYPRTKYVLPTMEKLDKDIVNSCQVYKDYVSGKNNNLTRYYVLGKVHGTCKALDHLIRFGSENLGKKKKVYMKKYDIMFNMYNCLTVVADECIDDHMMDDVQSCIDQVIYS